MSRQLVLHHQHAAVEIYIPFALWWERYIHAKQSDDCHNGSDDRNTSHHCNNLPFGAKKIIDMESKLMNKLASSYLSNEFLTSSYNRHNIIRHKNKEQQETAQETALLIFIATFGRCLINNKAVKKTSQQA
ncbi:hypothetical protein CCACVL1_22370 [Corchorus capsularis]|uniref:Uncharacterized protein n=1 Tax=Corchorus capsularis TaxID=210143 RepID=A0A1R3GZT1_COCAP|nr:hypothetical protein CCACVL1_22370 [Corchorus capsularis]